MVVEDASRPPDANAKVRANVQRSEIVELSQLAFASAATSRIHTKLKIVYGHRTVVGDDTRLIRHTGQQHKATAHRKACTILNLENTVA